MRIPVVIFIIGAIMLIAGIVLAVAMPALVAWKPKSEVLATEKPLEVPVGWKSKSESLYLHYYHIAADYNATYDYWFAGPPNIIGLDAKEAKNFAISGTATEQSIPQLLFNFYVFDNINFYSWTTGATYTSFYEAEGKTSINFSFPITTRDAVQTFIYFVVEEYARGVKPVVNVTATISWSERASRYDGSAHYPHIGTLKIEQSKDFVLKGNVSEVAGNRFDFYILDALNYVNWVDRKAYTSYFERKNVTSTTFSIPLTEEQATSTIQFVAENPLLDTNETVKFSATLEWNEKATIAATVEGIVFGGIIALFGVIVIIIAGFYSIFS